MEVKGTTREKNRSRCKQNTRMEASLPVFYRSSTETRRLETGGRRNNEPVGNIDQDDAVIVNARVYPNPYNFIKPLGLDTYDHVHEWIMKHPNMTRKLRMRWERQVLLAVDKLNAGIPIRIECLGGRHRSVAMAIEIALRASFPIRSIVHNCVPETHANEEKENENSDSE